MKLTLIYPPFCWPSGVPLGIAYLKGQLKKELPGLAVKNIDLNIDFFNDPARIYLPSCSSCSNQFYNTCIPVEMFASRGEIEKCKRFFKKGESSFTDKHAYIENYYFYWQFFERLRNCYNYFLHAFLENDDPSNRRNAERIIGPDVERVLAEKPDLIGLSANIDQIRYALCLAKMLKKRSRTPIILGGYFASSFDSRQIMRAFPFLDYLIYKEGEMPLVELIRNFSAQRFAVVPNLVYRRNKRILVNREKFIKDLDEIAFPDFSDFDLKKYFTPQPVLPILASRGCYWNKCAFCDHFQNYSAGYRIRSEENVVKEMQLQQKEHGVKYFLFCDEQISAASLQRLSEKIISAKLHVYYGLSGFRPAKEVSRRALKIAYTSGCRWVYLGVESLTQRILDLMEKGTQVRQVLRVIKWCRELGIYPFSSFMLGFPTQTAKEVEAEAALCAKHKDFLTIPGDGIKFDLMKDSRVYRHPEKYKISGIRDQVLFNTGSGVVSDMRLCFSPQAGVTSQEAKEIFVRSVTGKTRFELGAFWEHMVILSAHKTGLIFSRPYFDKLHKSILKKWFKAPDYSSGGKYPSARASRYFGKGVYLKNLNQYDSAIANFSRARKLSKERFTKALIDYHLGDCYEKQGDYLHAVQGYQRGVALVKDISLRGLFVLALARNYFHLGRFREVIAAAGRMDARGYQDKLSFVLGRSYAEIADYPRAIIRLRRAEAVYPNNPEINFLLAQSYKSLGRVKSYKREISKGMQKMKISAQA